MSEGEETLVHGIVQCVCIQLVDVETAFVFYLIKLRM